MEEDIEDELALAEASGDEDAIQELTIDEDAVYNQALNLQWRNKAVSDTYYPGSVYKMCVGAMALEEGVVTLDSTFTCTGNMPVEGVEGGINCWKREGPRPGDLRRRHLQLLQPLDDPHRPAPGGRYVL